jgi:hypothetical protein
MKAKDVNEICEANDKFNFDWKKTIVKPVIIGFAFGVGFYLASLFLKTEIMIDLLEEAKEAKFKKLARLSSSRA